MINGWRKLNYLIPEPDCDTANGVITEWRDSRPRPTDAEIAAVVLANVRAAEQEQEEDSLQFEQAIRKIARHNFNLENRMRVLESKPAITWKQFVKALRQST